MSNTFCFAAFFPYGLSFGGNRTVHAFATRAERDAWVARMARSYRDETQRHAVRARELSRAERRDAIERADNTAWLEERQLEAQRENDAANARDFEASL